MKIVADENIPFVKDAFRDFGLVSTCPGREITQATVEKASTLLVRSVTRVNRELLEGSSVQFVATATIGCDHIDLDYLKNNSIGFASAPGSNADSVAEFMAASLCHLAEDKGLDLSTLTLGVIGLGNVGSRVFKVGTALGMRCIANDPPKQRMTDSDFFVPLEQLLAESDVITLHVPLNRDGGDATFHLVNEAFLNGMKPGAILFNSSRGPVVDEAVLLHKRDRLGGLVLDVWETEPDINLDLLAVADIATPHIAGYAYDGKVRGTQMILDSACAFTFKKPAWNMNDQIGRELVRTIDVSKAANPVFKAVADAYPVMKDDAALREIASLKSEQRAKFFDTLRKEYWKRREFYNFKVVCPKGNDACLETLRALRFVAETK